MKDEFFLVRLFNGSGRGVGAALSQEIFDDLVKARKHIASLTEILEPGDQIEFDNCNKHGEVY